jgi:hypothetical protein
VSAEAEARGRDQQAVRLALVVRQDGGEDTRPPSDDQRATVGERKDAVTPARQADDRQPPVTPAGALVAAAEPRRRQQVRARRRGPDGPARLRPRRNRRDGS